MASRYAQLNDREWLEDRYVRQGLSTLGIAKEVSCNEETVRQALKRLGVRIRTLGEAQEISVHRWLQPSPNRFLSDPQWLRQMADSGARLEEIAHSAGAGASSVLRALARHGIERKRRQRQAPGNSRLQDAQWMHDAYVAREMSTGDIARDVGCTAATARRWLMLHGIPIRSRSEASKLWRSSRSERMEHQRNRQMVTAGRGARLIEHLETGDGHGAIR